MEELLTEFATVHVLPMIWIFLPNIVVVLDSMESSDNNVRLMPLEYVSCRSPSRTEKVVLELNCITGTRRVLSRMAS